MSDDVKQAIADLQSFVVCHCSPAYTGRKLRDPDCYCEYAPEVKAVADRIERLEAKLAKAVEALRVIRQFNATKSRELNIMAICNMTDRAHRTLTEIEGGDA
jgi:hypothetical protein